MNTAVQETTVSPEEVEQLHKKSLIADDLHAVYCYQRKVSVLDAIVKSFTYHERARISQLNENNRELRKRLESVDVPLKDVKEIREELNANITKILEIKDAMLEIEPEKTWIASRQKRQTTAVIKHKYIGEIPHQFEVVGMPIVEKEPTQPEILSAQLWARQRRPKRVKK